MADIFAKNNSFSGTRAGVLFKNGKGETDNEYLIQWFFENGYEVKQNKETLKKTTLKKKE